MVTSILEQGKNSFYDYVWDFHGVNSMPAEGLYEFDSDKETPFWEPASFEDELREQLQNFTISSDGLM